MPSIILTGQFTTPNSNSYPKFVSYMVRQYALKQKDSNELSVQDSIELNKINNALNNLEIPVYKNSDQIEKYVDYMTRTKAIKDNKLTINDSDVVAGAFSKHNKRMNKDDIAEVKSKIIQAGNNNAVLFQDVVSFETDFLKKQHILSSDGNELDIPRLYDSVDSMMNTAQRNEDLHNFEWFASVHRNTQHVHIHIASFEMENTRRLMPNNEARGLRKQSTLDSMKNDFATTLLDRTNELTRISDLRNQLNRSFKKTYVMAFENVDKNLSGQLKSIKHDLPSSKSEWIYGGKKITPALREKIDSFTMQIALDNPVAQRYLNSIENERSNLKELYGKSDKVDKAYNERLDLYKKRIGNAFLQELRNDTNKESKYSKILDNMNMNFPTQDNPNRKNIVKRVKITNSLRNKSNKHYNSAEISKMINKKSSNFKNKKDVRKIKRAILDHSHIDKAQRDYNRLQARIQQEQNKQSNEIK